jgi:hypothetical protein
LGLSFYFLGKTPVHFVPFIKGYSKIGIKGSNLMFYFSRADVCAFEDRGQNNAKN